MKDALYGCRAGLRVSHRRRPLFLGVPARRPRLGLVYLNWRNRRHGRGEFTTRETAPWSLGRWAAVVNAIAIAWVALITVIFVLPPNELVLWTMLAVGVALALYWQLSARRRFVGPRGG
jgi:hypothetical protein